MAPGWWSRFFGGLSIGGIVGLVVTCGAGLWVYANHDIPDLFDDPAVVEPTDRACNDMVAVVARETVPAGASVDVRVNVIRRQDQAVTDMVARVRSLGKKKLEGDMPANSWLADWETLVKARERYADDLAAGRKPAFTVPRTDDGYPITGRMNDVSLTCRVPETLIKPA